MPVDWKKLADEWHKVSAELAGKIETILREKPKEKLAELFEKEPDAQRVYERVIGTWTPPPPLKDILWGKFSESLRAKGLDPERFRSEFEADYEEVKELRRNHAERTIERKAAEIARREVGPPPVKPVEVEEKPSVVERPSIRWNEEAVPAEVPLIVRRPLTKEELEAEAEEREAKRLGIPLIKYKELKKFEALPTDEDKVMNLHLARFSEEYIAKDVGIPLEDVKRIIREHEIKSLYLEGTPVERIVEDTGLTTEQVKVIVEKKGYYG